jgi:hypothetical protein
MMMSRNLIEPEYDMDDVGKQAEFDRRRRKETEKAGKMSDPPSGNAGGKERVPDRPQDA